MLKFLKKYWYLVTIFLILDVFLLIIGVFKSDKEITTPGGISPVNSLISVDNDFFLEGSFNTVYVISYDYVTELGSFLVNGLDKTSEVSTANKTFDLTLAEIQKSGEIQKNQSISTSIIVAYEAAIKNGFDFNIDYDFKGFIIYTYQIEQDSLRIGDIIYAVKHQETTVSNTDGRVNLGNAINSITVGDTIYYTRDGINKEYVVNKEIKYDNMNMFYAYSHYVVNYETLYPKITLHSSNSLGPSGGFLQTLATYCYITKNDLTNGLKIAGTGTISINGSIGPIGGISQKITGSIRNKVDVFLCPSCHYEEALETYNKTNKHERMKLIEIPDSTSEESSFYQAIKILEDLINE